MTDVRRRCVLGLFVALVLVLSACGDGQPSSSTATSTAPSTGASPGPTVAPPAGPTTTVAGAVVAVTVKGGQVQGPSRQRVKLDDAVTVRVTSDVADEIHVHGYDETAPVAAGATGEVSFVADIPGVFEVEFEDSGQLLFTLEVGS